MNWKWATNLKLARAMRRKRSAVIPLGAAGEDEEARARQHAIEQTLRYACGVRDEISRVCAAGYRVESMRMADGSVRKHLVLTAANPTVVGWVETLFGVTVLWMEGWDAEAFRAMTDSSEILRVDAVDKLPYRIGGMVDALALSCKCGMVRDYLRECCGDRIPGDLLARLKPAQDVPERKPYRICIDRENPCRVVAVRNEAGSPALWEKVYPVRIHHIRQSEEGQYTAVDILDFAWKIPLEGT